MSDRERPEKLRATTFDGLAAALSPALIIGMIGSLVFFLVIAFYRGQYDLRLMYILGLYTAAIVLVARIAIESDRMRAAMFAAPLAIAAMLGMTRFVTINGDLAALSWIVNVGLLALTWYLADRITFDCTLLKEDRESLQGGLLQTIGSSVAQAAGQEKQSDKPAQPTVRSSTRAQQPIGAAPLKKAKHNPGVWVLYFALLAFPLFGVGQLVIPDERQRSIAFWCLVTYLGCSLSLLMTTSLLGMRRYLRQRGAMMPPDITTKWLVAGGLITIGLLIACMLMPLPGKQLSVAGLKLELTSPDHQTTSRFGWGNDGREPSPTGQQSDSQSDNQAADQGASDQQSQANKPGSDPKPSDQGRQQDGQQSNNQQPNNQQSNNQQSNNQQSNNQQSNNQQPNNQQPNNQQPNNQQPNNQQPNNQQPNNQQPNNQQSSNQQSSNQQSSNPQSGNQQSGKSQNSSSQKNNDSSNSDPNNAARQNEPVDRSPPEPSKQPRQSREPQGNKREPSQDKPDGNPPRDESKSDVSRPREVQRPDEANAPNNQSTSSPMRAGDSLSKASRSLASSLLDTLKTLSGLFKWLLIAVLAGIVLFFVATHFEEVKRLITDLLNFINALMGGKPSTSSAVEPEEPSNVAEPTSRPFSSFVNPFAKGLSGWQGPQVVQHTFAAMEAWAAARGRKRPVHQTAEEFARTLVQHEPELDRLPLQAASMLDRVMFAGWQPTREEVRVLSQLWERMS